MDILSLTRTIRWAAALLVTGLCLLMGATTADAAPSAPAIASPSANSTVAGTVGVVARAGSVIGAASVELAVDGAVIGSATAPPWGIVWDTRGAAEGSHELRLTAIGSDGARTASPAIRVNVRNGAGGGLEATYFNDRDLSDPATTRVDPNVDFDWGRGRPVAGMPADGFAARWAGTVEAPTTDSYTFSVAAEDGVRMWFGGKLVIDKWSAVDAGQHAFTTQLVAGRRYALRLEYSNDVGDSSIRLRWKSFHSAMTTIPARLLRPESGGSSRTWGLRATFFGERTLRAERQLATRVDSVLDFDWGHDRPGRELPRDDFSARWEGTVRAPKAGVYRFWTTADDGIRLQVGAKRVLVDWSVHAPRTRSGVVRLRKGVRYPIKLDYFEGGGSAKMKLEWQAPGGKRGPIPPNLLTPAPGPPKPPAPTTGLVGTYYDEVNFTKPIVQRLDQTVNFEWKYGLPDPELNVDNYSARWTGSVTAPIGGEYRIATRGDDGVRLFIDQQPIIDDWTVHSPTWREGKVTLEAGRSYDIELQYFQGTGRASIQLGWTPPGGARAVIPTEYLAPRPPSPEPMKQLVPAPPAVPVPGLWGVYYDNEDFTGTMQGRADAQLAMKWKTGRPHPAIGSDTFSVAWTGSLAVPLAGSYRLATEADDGVRVWLDGQLVIDRWKWRSPPIDRSAPLALMPGRRYALRVEHHDASGESGIDLRWSSERIPEQSIPTWALMTPGEASAEVQVPVPTQFAVTEAQLAAPGLLGLYWDDVAYLQPKIARVDATVDGRYGTNAPSTGTGMGRDEFAIRWLGSVEVPRAGAWRFHVTVDDGARLWVCGQLVIDEWKDRAAAEFASLPITMAPGTRCPIRLDYYERSGDASVKLQWSAADQAKQLVPSTALKPPALAELGPLWWW